nr:hypothetical protein [uncultured Dysosmobacter sp.]
MNDTLILILFGAFLLAALAVIAAMFVSLAKQGDERRRLIVEKASAGAFAVTALYILFSLAESVYLVCSGKDLSPVGMNPFITLTVIAVVYAGELFYQTRRYGG